MVGFWLMLLHSQDRLDFMHHGLQAPNCRKDDASVTARKDDAAAADQAAKAKVAVPMSSACDGGLIQTTSG